MIQIQQAHYYSLFLANVTLAPPSATIPTLVSTYVLVHSACSTRLTEECKWDTKPCLWNTIHEIKVSKQCWKRYSPSQCIVNESSSDVYLQKFLREIRTTLITAFDDQIRTHDRSIQSRYKYLFVTIQLLYCENRKFKVNIES